MTTIIIANRSYAILEFEFSRVGAEGDGAAAHALMDITQPVAGLRGAGAAPRAFRAAASRTWRR